MKFPIIIVLLVLILSRRIKRGIGFQKYNEATLIIRMVLFSLISLTFLAFAFLYPKVLISNSLGIIAGLVLAYIATNHAQFEKRENGLYFKTHIWVEMIVICLFLARYAYRFFVVKDMLQSDVAPQDAQAKMQAIQDPITGAILFTFCAYYLGYFSFILKEGKKALKNDSSAAPKP